MVGVCWRDSAIIDSFDGFYGIHLSSIVLAFLMKGPTPAHFAQFLRGKYLSLFNHGKMARHGMSFLRGVVMAHLFFSFVFRRYGRTLACRV